jgi:4-amino-4-deoxy-L-arabinose transferase-like glycosyltransferase
MLRRPPWRSPPGQPRWARPALLTIAALAGLTYAWGLNSAVLEAFYGAAARSMSTSWHDFLFGAFDPAGTVTVDKLPGSLWPQALSLRLFGFHIWAVVLPQVLEGVLTVLVLYRAVRRLAGPVAGIVAVSVLAITPVTVTLNRGNVADSLLILLTVLAADATCAALLSGRLRSLILAGVWVGLAFQVKMLEAWLVAPALAVAYLVAAAPPRLRTRVSQLLIAGAVTVALSMSWMTVVSLVPTHDRPYVDGTRDNSVFSQVFDYNGIARLEHATALGEAGRPAAFLEQLGHTGSVLNNPAHRVAPSWHRLLGGPFGRDIGWLVPAALIAAAAVLLERRRAGRHDPLRASVLLWGTWLIVLWAFFSAGGSLNSYYMATMSPAIAGLCGTGFELFWRHRRRPAARATLAAALVTSVAYGLQLLNGGAQVPGWLIPAAVCLGAAGVVALLAAALRPERVDPHLGPILALAATAILLLPAVTSILGVTRRLGPFAAPYEPASAVVSPAAARHDRQIDLEIVEEISAAYPAPIAFATDTSTLAGPYILYTGREILPIGGYQGGIPSPTLAQLRRYIASGQVRAFLVPLISSDPRIAWVHAHCARVSKSTSASRALTALYDCG